MLCVKEIGGSVHSLMCRPSDFLWGSFLSIADRRCALFFKHVSFVIRENQCCQWEGDDEADEPEQAAPNGEGQKDDRGIEPCHLPHDAWGEKPILYGLYNAEDDDDGKNDSPKTFSSIVRFEQCQDDGRDEADGLQIGHEVEKSDE